MKLSSRLIHLILVFFLLDSSLVWAQHEGHSHQQENTLPNEKPMQNTKSSLCKNIIKAQVNGLVCDFCARALEKIFGKREDISSIDVDLNKREVSIAMKPGKTIDDTKITQLITDSGYSVIAIHKECE